MRGLGKTLALLLAFVVLTTTSLTPVKAQPSNAVSAPATEWQQEYGNRDIASVSNVVQASDGGYAFLDLGYLHQFSLVPSTFYKVNSSGNMQWHKKFDSFDANSLVQTSDDGFIILGAWSTFETTQETPTLIKIDSDANMQWYQNYSIHFGEPTGLLQTNDSGFTLLFQNTNYQQGNFANGASIIKTDSYGRLQWNNMFDANGNYTSISSFIQTSDGGYAIIGSSSFNGTIDTPNLYYWLTKTDSRGNVEWSRQYGNGPPTVNTNQEENVAAYYHLNREVEGDNEGKSVIGTADGGFLVAGTIYSQRKYPQLGSVAETLLIKTDNHGNVEWNRTLDGDMTSQITQTSDGGLALASSKGIIKTDSTGATQWLKNVTFQNIYTMPLPLGVSSLIETSDGALAGIGTGTDDEWFNGNIYLIKTEAFLPLSSPIQLPTSMATPINERFLALEIIAVAITVVVSVLGAALLLLRRHRKILKEEIR